MRPNQSSPQLNDTARLRYPAGVTPHTIIGEGTFTVGSGNRPSSTCAGSYLSIVIGCWTFLRQEGVESTNNASERALRHAVIWRKPSFETQNAGGSRFVETMPTSVEICRKQRRDDFDLVTAAVLAHFARQISPFTPHPSVNGYLNQIPPAGGGCLRGAEFARRGQWAPPLVRCERDAGGSPTSYLRL